MPAYSKDNEQYHIDRIRVVLFYRPKAGALMIQKLLEQDHSSPLHLHHDYINRLLQKIRKERSKRQSQKVAEEISTIEDEFEWLREKTIDILTGNAKPDAKIRAIAQSWKMRIDLYNAKLDAGIFERQLGKLKTDHSLNKEQQDLLDKALDYALRRPQREDQKRPDIPEGSSESELGMVHPHLPPALPPESNA